MEIFLTYAGLKQKPSPSRVHQYADDIAIFSDTPEGLQSLLTSHNDVTKKMGLYINTVKTETMC